MALSAPMKGLPRALPTVTTDLAVLGYALWTLGCNVAVKVAALPAALDVVALLTTAGLLAVVAMALAGARPLRAYRLDLERGPILDGSGLSPREQRIGLGWIAATLVLWWVTRSAWLAWSSCGLFFLTLALLSLRRAKPVREQVLDEGSPWPELLLQALAIACGLFTLWSFRPRGDEPFYLSMALSVTQHPELALLSAKTLHGPPTDLLPPQYMFPPYRVHSFELLGGYLSKVLGRDAIAVVHLGVAPVCGYLVPLAVARLLRTLTPRRWLLGTCLVVLFYLIEGTASRGYANQAFVRLFNGKGVLLSCAVPLLFLHGIRFGAGGTTHRLVLLCAAQITAVGLSSTGIWLAPLVAGLGVLAGAAGSTRLARTLLTALLSMAHAALAGLWVLSELGIRSGAGRWTKSVAAAVTSGQPQNPFLILERALPIVLGGERTVIAHISIAALACLVARSALSVRLLTLVGATLSVFLLNPLLAKLVGSYLTGTSTYQRVFWALPIPVVFAIAASAMLDMGQRRFGRSLAAALSVGFIGAYLGLATERLVMSENNGFKWTPTPQLKIWPNARQAAMRACAHAPGDACILATESVSGQLAIINGCPPPLFTVERWIRASRAEKDRRALLVRHIADRGDLPLDHVERYAQALRVYKPSMVVMSVDAAGNRRTKDLLLQEGYLPFVNLEGYHIWRVVEGRSKYWTLHRRLAGSACKRTPAGRGILAPFGISRQIALRACGQAVLGPSQDQPPDFEEARYRRLEGLLSRAGDIEAQERSWLSQQLQRFDVGTVVLSKQGRANRGLLLLLQAEGFRAAKKLDGHLILVRQRPREPAGDAAAAAAPSPKGGNAAP